jgi:hypothetical protein
LGGFGFRTWNGVSRNTCAATNSRKSVWFRLRITVPGELSGLAMLKPRSRAMRRPFMASRSTPEPPSVDHWATIPFRGNRESSITVACELVPDGADELVVVTAIDLDDGLAGAILLDVQAARLSRITAVTVAIDVRRILPT